ncbi:MULTISPECIES: hypothetical protein [unclassified Glutamicibacter]|uniref:hypothetical protein n=1 Tax=unclassified Glutamicibacter TaxID=2627139 RepID=UPI002FCC68AB
MSLDKSRLEEKATLSIGELLPMASASVNCNRIVLTRSITALTGIAASVSFREINSAGE